VCDTLCVLRPDGALFAKNSDRPPAELQLVGVAPRRPAGEEVATQYLSIPDSGALATLLARPTWLWGAEHGVNERRVAIGNERVYTASDPRAAPPALIGMDLVRLALERAGSADAAVSVIGELLERHGQGGIADELHGEAYFSSFLVADPSEAWMVETSGRSWVAERAPVAGAAVSNRLSLRTGWGRGSPDVALGTDVDTWRDQASPTAHADRRLEVSRGFVARGGDPSTLVAVLRDHGQGRWPAPTPSEVGADFSGVTVCMHLPGYMATTSSIVADLPRDPDALVRCWVAPGSPCVSVYVPALPPQTSCPRGAVAPVLGDERAWRDVAALRELVERSGNDILAAVRDVLDPLEAALWDEADTLGASPSAWTEASTRWSDAVGSALSDAVVRLSP
jgi:secernin